MFDRLRRAGARSAPHNSAIDTSSQQYPSQSLPHHFSLSLPRRLRSRTAPTRFLDQSHPATASIPPTTQPSQRPPPSSAPLPNTPSPSSSTSSAYCSTLGPHDQPRMPYDGACSHSHSHFHTAPHIYASTHSYTPFDFASASASSIHTASSPPTAPPHIAYDADLESGLGHSPEINLSGGGGAEDSTEPKPIELEDDDSNVERHGNGDGDVDGAGKKKKKMSPWKAIRIRARTDPLSVAGVLAGVVVLPFVIRGATR